MRRRVALGLAVLAAGCTWASAAEPKASRLEQIPDRTYRPKEGDHAVVCYHHKGNDQLYDGEGATYSFAYRDYWKSLKIKDDDGVRELRERRLLVDVSPGTPVLVIETEKFDTDDPRADCVVVRVLTGPHKGKKLWLSEFEVTRMVPNPAYAPPAPPPAVTPRDSLRAAEAKEAAFDWEGALLGYRVLVALHPGTPEAEKAAQRIRALETSIKEWEQEDKASRLVTIAVNLERSGKKAAALTYFRRVVKEYPRTKSAIAAGEWIRTLTEKP